jgi:hypothetical protein
VERAVRVRFGQLPANSQTGVESGEGLGKSPLAGEQPANVDVAPGQVALGLGAGGVGVGQLLKDGQRLAP